MGGRSGFGGWHLGSGFHCLQRDGRLSATCDGCLRSDASIAGLWSLMPGPHGLRLSSLSCPFVLGVGVCLHHWIVNLWWSNGGVSSSDRLHRNGHAYRVHEATHCYD